MSRPLTPLLTVDIIIEMHDRPEQPIVLIERKYPPHGWALPGGFVDVGERLETAALREAREETSLDVKLRVLLGCYSDPARDPRGHTVTMIYVARASGDPIAADDAADVAVFDPENVDVDLAFDHEKVIADYLSWRNTGTVPAIT